MAGAKRILVVDDEKLNVELLEGMLGALGHESVTANDGHEAIDKLDPTIDLVLMDVMMPGMDGFAAVKTIRAGSSCSDVPVIMVTALTSKEDRLNAVAAGANDYITKPVDRTELKIRSDALLSLKEAQDQIKRHQEELELKVEERTSELSKALETVAESHQHVHMAYLDTIRRLALAAEFRDEQAATHLHRVRHFSAILAEGLGLPEDEVEIVRHATPMHDVGKIGLPDEILRKTGKLTPDEWTIMKQHTIIGAQILRGSFSPLLRAGEHIALSHHEKWDGSGYPHGLKGESIPLYARICAVGDVFDALTTRRPYKEAFPNAQAFHIIKEGAGAHFDPQLVDLFFKDIERVLQVQDQYRDDPDVHERFQSARRVA